MENEQLPSVLDFVEPVVGPMPAHRRDWLLRPGAGAALLELINRSPEAGKPFLDLVLGSDDKSHLVSISDRLCLVCTTEVTQQLYPGLRGWWRLDVQKGKGNDSRIYYWTLLGIPQPGDDHAVIDFLHRVVALDNRVCKTVLAIEGHDSTPELLTLQNALLPAIQSLVSLPRSRRTAEFYFHLTLEVQRAIAFHCSPLVELDVLLIAWQPLGQVLSEAMRANRCPARLVLHHIFAAPFEEFAPALAGTTSIKELTVHVQHGPDTEPTLSAIGQNRGITHVVAVQEGPVTAGVVRTFWEAVMNSPTIVSVDATGITGNRASLAEGNAHPWPPFENDRDFNQQERRECAELVASLIRTNRRIKRVSFHSRALDAQTMETSVAPIILLNRLRPVVASLPGGSVGEMAREKSVSGLLLSSRFGKHPDMLYCLLNSTRDWLLASQE